VNARRVITLFLTLSAGALLSASGRVAPGVPGAAATSDVRLKTISTRVGAAGASLVIEATEPVGYVATRPDPLTVALDFRNVDATGVANRVAANAIGPIAAVAVEASEWLGAPASRVRITLSQPVTHRVRSNRNTVVIEFDRFDRPSAKAPAAAVGSVALGSTSGGGAADALKALEIAQSPAVEPVAAETVSRAPRPSSSGVTRFGQAAALQQPATPGQGDQTARRFTGNLVSLDFQGADLRAVIRTFAEISGLNIVIDPQVMGSVDVQLREVPWDQALDLILRSNKLGYAVDGTIVRIVPVTVLKAEADERLALAKAEQDAALNASPVERMTLQLSYSTGAQIVELLRSGNILSTRGQAFVDARTNTLIVTDVQERLPGVTALIASIDKPQPQVEIEARIVQTNKTYARQLGVQWGFNATPANDVLLGGRIAGGTAVQGPNATSTAVNQPVGGATSAVGIALGSVNGTFRLDAALSALEASGNGRILSTPKVSTVNNVQAEMTQGIQIPIQQVANNTITVNFKDAALKLLVTPQITASNTVIMNITLENATPDFGRQVGGIPPINTQRALTTVLVNDGQTTVIGGIYTSTTTNSRTGTPGLSGLPLFGWLFRRDVIDDQNTELLIFITPRIIRG